MKELKELKDHEVYLRPTGNYARGGGKKYVVARVTKVARVYVTIIKDGSRYEEKYRFHGNVLSNGFNSGYIVYESMQDLEDYYSRCELASRISGKYSNRRDYEGVDLSILRQVASLLGV